MLFSLLLLVAISFVVLMFYQNANTILVVTSSGGMCSGGCNHPKYRILNDGTFEGHRKLSSSEVSELKEVINDTDFTEYTTNIDPKCQSFVDGSDEVLIFPNKHGDNRFTTCMLNIPENDKAYSFIHNLLNISEEKVQIQ